MDLETYSVRDLIVSAKRVGFQNTERFLKWVGGGYNASMSYLSREDGIVKRVDTSLLLERSKSIIVFLLNYRRRRERKDGYGKIASYATFKDYHVFFLKMIERFVVENQLFEESFKAFVDTGPVMERDVARGSSLGWVGKNSMLINQRVGSFTFIGTVITDLIVDSEHVSLTDLCGTCTRCIESCPTQAIRGDRTVDSNLCISYHTIENRGIIPASIALRTDDMIFGCDVCNDVCPWNRTVEDSTIREVQEDPFSNKAKLEEIAYMDKESFDHNFRHSAIRRATHQGLARNALIALFNSGRMDIVRDVAKEFKDLRGREASLLIDYDLKRS